MSTGYQCSTSIGRFFDDARYCVSIYHGLAVAETLWVARDTVVGGSAFSTQVIPGFSQTIYRFAFPLQGTNTAASQVTINGGSPHPLSGGAIAGIVVGGVALVGLVLGLCWFVLRQRKRRLGSTVPELGHEQSRRSELAGQPKSELPGDAPVVELPGDSPR